MRSEHPSAASAGPSHHGWAGDLAAVARRCGERVRIEESDCVRGFAIASTQTPLSQLTALIQPNPVTATKQVIEGHPGAILTLSANREVSGTGIPWMTYAQNPAGQDATLDTRLGQLAAYDAENLTRQLWHSDMAAGARDALGYFAKFNPPTVANGKVYAATLSCSGAVQDNRRQHLYFAE